MIQANIHRAKTQLSKLIAQRLQRMPLFHHDPFVQTIVAQALARSVPLVTRDTLLADYGVAAVRA